MKAKLSAVALAVMASLALAACSGGISEPNQPGGAETAGTSNGDGAERGQAEHVIRYATQHTEANPFSRAIERWGEEIEERTDGRISVEMFYSASLLPAAEVLPGIIDQRATTGFVVDLMFGDFLPLTVASAIPFDRTNGVAQALAYHEVYKNNEGFRAEYEDLGLHVLLFQPPGATVIGSLEEIPNLDAVAGLDVRCIGFICNAMEGVGANPVALASTDIYEAMDRATIDAWSAYPFMDMLSTQFQEVTPYVTDPGFGTYMQAMAPISLDTWNSYSEEDRQIITEVSDEYYQSFGDEMYLAEEETCAASTAAGVQLSVISEEDQDAWREAVYDDIYSTWAQQASGSAQMDPDEFYSELMETYERMLGETDFNSKYVDCMNGELG